MKAMYAGISIFLLLALGFLFYNLLIEYDKKNRHKIWVKRNVTPDCNYELPNRYFVAYDSIQNKYAIVFMHIDTYRYFLELKQYSTLSDKIYNMSGHNEATTFDDSCTAKGFFKIYASQELIDNFKIK